MFWFVVFGYGLTSLRITLYISLDKDTFVESRRFGDPAVMPGSSSKPTLVESLSLDNTRLTIACPAQTQVTPTGQRLS